MWITSPHTIHMSILHNYHLLQWVLTRSHRNENFKFYCLIRIEIFVQLFLLISIYFTLLYCFSLSIFLSLYPSHSLSIFSCLPLYLSFSISSSVYFWFSTLPLPSCPLLPYPLPSLFIYLYLSHSGLFSYSSSHEFKCAHYRVCPMNFRIDIVRVNRLLVLLPITHSIWFVPYSFE